MPTALVTGAAGFTGQYLVRALARRGYEVIGMGVGGPANGPGITCDLADKTATREAVERVNPDVVVHLAAVSFVGDAPESFYRVNVIGTLNLLEALANCRRPPARTVIASSANVYGNGSGGELTEETCPAPVNHYGASKLAMEHMVRTWFDRLPILMTRPFNYTGPGQEERFVVAKIVAHYRRRANSIELGNLDIARDFSDVEDVVEAYLRLLESEARSEVVNICSGTTISISEILATMNEIAGYEIEVRQRADLMRSSDITRLAGSNRKLRELTGFAPQIAMRETLRRMYAE